MTEAEERAWCHPCGRRMRKVIDPVTHYCDHLVVWFECPDCGAHMPLWAAQSMDVQNVVQKRRESWRPWAVDVICRAQARAAR
jgi:predicted RNA-binding Zn-ribbon protein involved in translation (DUF1610 family)